MEQIMEQITDTQLVEQYVNSKGSTIEDWYGKNKFCDVHGCNGFIFNTQDEATECVLNGDEHQNAIDYVNGAQTSDDWIKSLINAGVDSDAARDIIENGDWETVVDIIVSECGPEWFLSQYSGEVHELSNGKLLYY